MSGNEQLSTTQEKEEPTAGDDERSTGDGDDELQLQVELLREENERLRRSYALARRSSYRRSALGLAAVGVLATVGAVLFPTSRDVLLALGGTGLFGAVLTYYLTPERFVAADVGTAVYGAMADTEGAIVDDLGLTDRTVYVPTGASNPEAWLFVPQHAEYEIPDGDALAAPFVVGDEPSERGVSIRPTGSPLVREFDAVRTGDPGDDPAAVVDQFADAVTEQFELAESLNADVSPDERRATVGVTDSAFGGVDRFDHPIPSVLAVGLAGALDAPVVAETTSGDAERADYLVTLRWPETATA
ncbi:hypothetical protein [Halostella sp. PRR32]|uniref:hypothetical protein n=1 Tax=Halostella sp. PRR32 TaxID=3098147 RepID=UPI002B1D735D|nr:hypothetical protein [Halostella sp. PRR32]